MELFPNFPIITIISAFCVIFHASKRDEDIPSDYQDDIRGGTSTASLKGLTDASGQAEFAGLLSDVENAFAGGGSSHFHLSSLSPESVKLWLIG